MGKQCKDRRWSAVRRICRICADRHGRTGCLSGKTSRRGRQEAVDYRLQPRRRGCKHCSCRMHGLRQISGCLCLYFRMPPDHQTARGLSEHLQYPPEKRSNPQNTAGRLGISASRHRHADRISGHRSGQRRDSEAHRRAVSGNVRLGNGDERGAQLPCAQHSGLPSVPAAGFRVLCQSAAAGAPGCDVRV